MTMREVRLIDQNYVVLATARVAEEGESFGGTIDLYSAPAHVLALFEEFEEIVNGQMFSFLDEIQGRIGSIPIRAIFDDGEVGRVVNLQVLPSTRDVSFRLAGVASPVERPT